MIEIDGALGGGQMLRTALAMSALTGKPFYMKNIRGGRPKPGLKQQHLTCVHVVKEICNAFVEGAQIGSTRLRFEPGKLVFKNMEIDIGTAGAITLLIQAALPIVLFADKKVTLIIKGGTDVSYSVPIDSFRHVFLPHLKPYASIVCTVDKRGYYPKGGGQVTVQITPKYQYQNTFENLYTILRQHPIAIPKRENLIAIQGISHASKDLMNAQVAERQAKAAQYLLSRLAVKSNIRTEYVTSLSTGSGITLWALYESGRDQPIVLGGDALGAKGINASQVGQKAAQNLLDEINSDATIDVHVADQLVPYLALFGGNINVREKSEHYLSNEKVCDLFFP